MIQMSFNGTSTTLLEEKDLEWRMKMLFQQAFNDYLMQNYGISEAKFKQIIKDLAPEEFI